MLWKPKLNKLNFLEYCWKMKNYFNEYLLFYMRRNLCIRNGSLDRKISETNEKQEAIA